MNLQPAPLVTHRFQRHVLVRIRLCGAKCRLCENGHQFTAPLAAERIGYRKVRITEQDAVWFGCEMGDCDYQIVEAV